ncbi:response regulator transcription factor [Streptomyces sp. NPDC005474]|uniref:response regulator transcription factor n=1 Tax=Streptomyces sp. NPDC005474 TaxID=3154878 RepID=UPI003454A234
MQGKDDQSRSPGTDAPERAGNPIGEQIRVVLVDDHALVRAGLREILESQPDIIVVGEAASSSEAVAEVSRQAPHMVLLDVGIPGDDVTVTASRIREMMPQTKIIVLSMYGNPKLIQQLITSRMVHGYLLKTVAKEELYAAIRGIHRDPNRVVLVVSLDSLPAAEEDGDQVDLSRRELQILELVAEAMSNGQIASRLFISEASAKRHLHNIFVKLGAVSRIDAVNKAIKASLIKPRPNRTG